MSSCDVSPSPVTITAENARLTTLVSTLREESQAAHNLLKKYRLLLVSTRLVMERRIPERVTRAKVINTHDKATIEMIVAELDKMERLYSPHIVPDDGNGRVRGSPRDETAVPRPGKERGRNQGPLCVDKDVRGPEGDRGRNQGPLRVDEGRVQGSPAVQADVPSLGQGRGHTNGSPYPTVDWSMVRWKPALPNPVQCPILGASQDPDFYMEKQCVWSSGTYTPFTTTKNPFGSLPGYHTNRGVVAVPTTPVSGWLYSTEVGNWVLHACPPGVRRRGARGSRR